ncbi:MAG TPA: 3-hydroxybutyrate dehydrogenase, partial [Rhodospirillaceae bacterium]|nr:3-hydroxybutyrate dehydrogenase [Rhodospirillaceae bacterium]
MIEIQGNIQGKTALITGSTSGIGLGIARRLAAAGANIALNGFGDKGEIDALVSELQDTGVKVAYYPADMTKPDEITQMIHDAKAHFGTLDILVNNA